MYGLRPLPQHLKKGGKVTGPGTGTSDSIKTEVQAGSYIMPADSTAAIGEQNLGGLGISREMIEQVRRQKANGPGLGINLQMVRDYNAGKFRQQPDVPVALSNGEYEIPPEQVHALGAAVLEQVKNATHTPASGDEPDGPRQFFADGGTVQASNSFGLRKLPKREALKLGLPGFNPNWPADWRQKLADGGLVTDPTKQNAFDITNTPAAQRQAGAVPGNPERAQRMQAQYNQPVVKGELQLSPSTGGNASLGIERAVDLQSSPAAGSRAMVDAPFKPVSGVDDQGTNSGWLRTGIGADQAGGEIVGRRGANGAMEFTNDGATPGSAASARVMPAGGVGSIGDGLGTFSQGEPGDAARAHQSFERANEIRREMIADSRRGQVGEGGGRMTIVEDSSRSPSVSELIRDRQRERQANTEATREGTRQNILSGMDERLTGQLQRQLLGHEVEAAEQGRKRQSALSGILDGLDDPRLQGDARNRAERRYLMQADPKAFLAASANGDGLKLTEQQSKDLGYYTRGNEANAQLAQQGDALTARASGERGELRGVADTLVRGTPFLGESALGNSLVSQERQQAEQSGREVLSAILRKDTGAAITNAEMEIYGKMYLPQPGDSDQVLNQKAEARTRALESIRSGLGTAERKAPQLRDGQRNAGPARISDDAEYNALPSGSLFIAPDGSVRRKP